ncbi:unnamed protein product [Phytophthora lilii]|uniref:Unnamed protein product n=1 Tax=Phytophthora lilii TaxID=2077276 RepID=A0A9W6U5S8_9STRA|nr:unnamed protein product [Phytophthora lilii]
MSFGKSIVEGDPWMPIRPFLDGFNERRLQVVSPGSVLCVDESMSAWKSREGKYCHDGIPHKTKIVRKPEGLGAELKAIADGDTGIILSLELVEGSTRQRQKPYAAEYGEGTAVVLRLAERFRGTGRTVVADSAFASVKTLIQLEARTGLFFMGMVKTATMGFPMKHLKDWFATGPNRGSFKVLSSTTDMGTPMYAACWADRKPKTIIANRGTTLPGTDAVRLRHRLIQRDGIVETLRFEKRIQRPQMIEYFFSKFSTVDVHNHLRQGSLALEREWTTMFWGHRLFSTLLGMITVDAYLAYRYEACDESHTDNTVLDFHGFLSQLAHQLIFNDFHSARTTRSNADGSTVEDDMPAPHNIEQLIRLPQYAATRKKKYRAQRKCNLCSEKASYYCVDCSDTARGVFYCVCGPQSKRDCFTKHLSTSN